LLAYYRLWRRWQDKAVHQNVMLLHPMLAEVSGASVSPFDVVNQLRVFRRNTAFYETKSAN
jgi:hypothetical protein